MSDPSPFKDAYAHFVETARTHFSTACRQGEFGPPDRRLDRQHESDSLPDRYLAWRFRSRRWHDILNRIGVETPVLPQTIIELEQHLGFGVWRLDYTQEIISYAHLKPDSVNFSSEQPAGKLVFERIKNRLMRIPFGRGTIGYVGENADKFLDKPYLCENSVGDLRGVVAVEDQIIGHVNIILVPISPVDADHGDIRLILSLFLPLPLIFSVEYAKSFQAAVGPCGQHILTAWERHAYGRFRDNMAVRSSIHSADLDNSIFEIIVAASHRNFQQTDPSASSDSKLQDAFPWVGKLKTRPVAVESDDISQQLSLETITEPQSFVRSRNLQHVHNMLAYSWYANTSRQEHLVPECNQRSISVSHRLWEESPGNIVDVILPLTNGAEILGQIRVHLSRFLLAPNAPFDNTAINRLLRPIIQTLESEAARDLHEALQATGNLLDLLRRNTDPNPVAFKLERQIEYVAFKEMFGQFSSEGNDADASDEAISEATPHTCVAGDPDPENAGEDAVALSKRLLDAVRNSLGPKLRDHVLVSLDDNSVLHAALGFSFWSLGDSFCISRWEQNNQTLLDEDTQINDMPPEHCSQLRDLQRILSFWPPSGSHEGERPDVRLNFASAGHSAIVEGIPAQNPIMFVWHPHTSPSHLTFTPEDDDRLVVSAISKDGDLLARQTWHLVENWPRIRVYHLMSGQSDPAVVPLEAHLKAIRDYNLRNENHASSLLRNFLTVRSPLVGHDERQAYVVWDESDTTSTIDEIARAAVRQIAHSEVQDMKLWAFPFQVFNHIYYWLIVGSRQRTGKFEPASSRFSDSPTQDLSLEMFSLTIGRASAQMEHDFTRRMLTDCHDLRDAKHQPGTYAREARKELGQLLSQDVHDPKELRLRAAKATDYLRRIENWCSWHDKMDLCDTLRLVLLRSLKTAIARHGASCGPEQLLAIQERLETKVKQRFPSAKHSISDDREDYRRLLVLLWADLFSNAIKHSGFTSEVDIHMSPSQEGKVILSNRLSPQARAKLEKNPAWLGVANNCLKLDYESDELSGCGMGLPNIVTWAMRLRTGLFYQPQIDDDVLAVHVHMEHLLR